MEQRKLELKHLAGYLPYGVMGYARALQVDLKSDITPGSVMNYINGETLYKPLLLPLDAITDSQWLEVFTAGVTSLHVKYPNQLLETPTIEHHDYAVEFLITPNDSITFDFIETQFGTDCRFNQLEAFSKIYELHGDLHNLIPDGLALNKLDYK